jgi:hypothetical protein
VTVSERRLEANRRNAARSTGPRTPEGKTVVALNAVKHGLLSREVLIKGESEAELVEFARRLRAQLAPIGELERLLVDRVVSGAWRLRRLVYLEAALLSGEQKPEDAFKGYRRESMAHLSRYEAGVERSLYRALAELHRLQAERGTEPVTVLDAAEVEAAALTPEEAA